MMICVYCIGCKWYRPMADVWCGNDKADECNNHEHYEPIEEE